MKLHLIFFALGFLIYFFLKLDNVGLKFISMPSLITFICARFTFNPHISCKIWLQSQLYSALISAFCITGTYGRRASWSLHRRRS